MSLEIRFLQPTRIWLQRTACWPKVCPPVDASSICDWQIEWTYFVWILSSLCYASLSNKSRCAFRTIGKWRLSRNNYPFSALLAVLGPCIAIFGCGICVLPGFRGSTARRNGLSRMWEWIFYVMNIFISRLLNLENKSRIMIDRYSRCRLSSIKLEQLRAVSSPWYANNWYFF